jgi:hypothetical protein
MRVDLSLREAELLTHRLEVGSAIAEALCDVGDEEVGDVADWRRTLDSDAVEARCLALLEAVGSGSVVIEGALDVAILEDCMTGSTFFADIDEAVACREITRQSATAYRLAAASVYAKLCWAAGAELGRWANL